MVIKSLVVILALLVGIFGVLVVLGAAKLERSKGANDMLKYEVKSRHINEIKIRDELVMTMDVGNGWRITDIWFDPTIPSEYIDCIKVKFERSE